MAWNAGSTNQEWYAYDASGNRVLRRSTTGSGTSITIYAFGLEEHLYGATGINTGNTYYYDLGGRIIGELTGITTLTTQFFLTDALGSVLATFSATAGSAAVLGNQVYGPYGNQRYTQRSVGMAKGYTGQYADATGLDYYAWLHERSCPQVRFSPPFPVHMLASAARAVYASSRFWKSQLA